jgi:hypothetical protein
MRVLVCGGRDYADRQRVDEVLCELPIAVLTEGGASGADRLAREWAIKHGVEVVTFTAAWQRHGRAAGPLRNQAMLKRGRPRSRRGVPWQPRNGGHGRACHV